MPSRLNRGITLEDVSFSYPGAAEPVLSGICLDIPAGQTLALVGENGAGKSTLVKLLCGLYQPTSGRILVDGADLADLDPEQWRARVATLFQDFTRIELTLGESIGHGDIARIADPAAVGAAVSQARAERVLRSVPGGLAGYVGRSYEPRRGAVRRAVADDRPGPLADAAGTAAAGTRRACRRARRVRGTRALRAVRLLGRPRRAGVRAASPCSSRTGSPPCAWPTASPCSTGGRLAEYGSHRDLMAADGLYAELFALQARAYG